MLSSCLYKCDLLYILSFYVTPRHLDASTKRTWRERGSVGLVGSFLVVVEELENVNRFISTLVELVSFWAEGDFSC